MRPCGAPFERDAPEGRAVSDGPVFSGVWRSADECAARDMQETGYGTQDRGDALRKRTDDPKEVGDSDHGNRTEAGAAKGQRLRYM